MTGLAFLLAAALQQLFPAWLCEAIGFVALWLALEERI